MPVDRSNLTQISLKRKFLAYTAARRADLHQHPFGWKAFRALLFLIANGQSLGAADIVARFSQERVC